MNTLGAKLKAARESKKLGQKEVEAITGISYKTLSNYENNRSEPDVEKLFLLCKAYDRSADYFVNLDYEKTHAYNFFLPLHEQEHIKRYRTLDPHGKESVDWTLNHEHIRCTAQKPQTQSEPLILAEERAPYNVVPFRQSLQPASAGRGTYLGPEAFETILVQENNLTRKALFGVPVSGDSMEPTYRDGDILIVARADDMEIGEIGIFTLDGEGFVKKLGKGQLLSLNKEYAPIAMNESITPNGRVVGVLDPKWVVG